MTYSIGEIAEKLGVTTSTLRYYDKEGLMPYVDRNDAGVRVFKDSDIPWLNVIGCLKKAGLPIKDIKNYIEMAYQGDNTIDARLQLFVTQREAIKKQIEELENTLAVLDYKCWYYETARAKGTTEGMENAQIPDEHKSAWKRVHE